VLASVAQAPTGRSVTDLATQLGVGRTVVYRLIATLEAHQLVTRDNSGRVRLGTGALRLAGRVVPLMRDSALPALRRLAEDVPGRGRGRTELDGLPRRVPGRR
jgi:DNA-binding IclR family transcriptional regulator